MPVAHETLEGCAFMNVSAVVERRLAGVRVTLFNVAFSLLSVYRRSLSPFRHVTRYRARIKERDVIFSTEDLYSNMWFFPRYSHNKIHEQPVTSLLVDVLTNARCFADIGTHLGWYTCVGATVAPKCKVYGFEMDDLSIALARKNIELNGCTNVQLMHAAVTDVAGTVSYTRSTMRPNPTSKIATNYASKDAHRMVVNAITLDEFFLAEGLMPDVIKIDVEGAEMNVLKGMRQILSQDRLNMFIEIHPHNLSGFHTSVYEIVSLLESYGFSVVEIPQMRKQSADVGVRDAIPLSKITHNAMLFVHKG